MTRQSFGMAAALAALLMSAPACNQKKTAETIEEPIKLVSSFPVNDPTAARQLVSGFYGIEDQAWRWTAQQFSVNLRPPVHTPQQEVELQFRFTIPKANLDKLGPITLSATAGGAPLEPEKYTKDGEHVYRSQLPQNLLTGDVVKIDFKLDKVIPPGDVDKRELGVIAASVGLVVK